MSKTRPSTVASNLEARTERDLLRNYLDDIVDMDVLDRDQQHRLLAQMETAERGLRLTLAEIPETARQLIARWKDRRAHGRVTGALSRWHRDGTNRDMNALIDTCFGQIEAAIDVLERTPTADVKRRTERQRELTERVLSAEVALPILLESLEAHEAELDRKQSGRDRRFKKLVRMAIGYRADLTDSKNQFISHNLRLVIRCAKNYRNRGVPFLDLIQEGHIGLIRAVEKFDHERGYQFSTYAIWWIEQSLVRCVANAARMVRIPSPLLDKLRQMKRLEAARRGATAGELSPLELIEEMPLDPNDAEDLRRSLSPEISTQALVGRTESLSVEEMLFEDDGEEILESVGSRELAQYIRELLPDLDDRERHVIEARLGMHGGHPHAPGDRPRDGRESRTRETDRAKRPRPIARKRTRPIDRQRDRVPA